MDPLLTGSELKVNGIKGQELRGVKGRGLKGKLSSRVKGKVDRKLRVVGSDQELKLMDSGQ